MKRVVIIEIVEVMSDPSRGGGERNKRKRQPAFVCNDQLRKEDQTQRTAGGSQDKNEPDAKWQKISKGVNVKE
jgi:hypothetical protein